MNFWPFNKQLRRIEVIRRDRCELTLAQWQEDKHLSKGGQILLANPYMKLAIDMLRNSHPGWLVMHPGMTLESRALQQARAEGYTMAIANLEAIGNVAETPKHLETTYEEEKEIKSNEH